MMERERCIGLMLFVFLAWAGPAFSKSETKAMKHLSIEKFTGKDDVYLEPTKFPEFSQGSCRENQKCSDWVEGNLSGLNRKDAAEEGKLVLKDESVPDRYMVAKYGLSDPRCFGAGEFDFKTGKYGKAAKETGGGWITLGNSEYTVLELSGNEENIIETPAEYRSITKVLFTWKVRAEGLVPNSYQCFKGKEVSGIQMRPLFCSARHACSIKQDFSGGQVKMRLYIKGKDKDGGVVKAKKAAGAEYDADGYAPLDPIAEMTLPSLDKITSKTEMTPGDPTVTGSRMVTKDDFDGNKLPAEIYFKLLWYNDSPVAAKSLGKQRSLIVDTDPITDIKEESDS